MKIEKRTRSSTIPILSFNCSLLREPVKPVLLHRQRRRAQHSLNVNFFWRLVFRDQSGYKVKIERN